MQILTPADFRRQPWANGRGETLELWRLDHPDGTLKARLSVATVAEDGPFSALPGIARCLTVIEGPGFRLTGPGLHVQCRPLIPVAFDGAIAVTASGTAAGASRDFNVMTDVRLPRPEVRVLHPDPNPVSLPAGGLLAVFALGPARVTTRDLPVGHLALTRGATRVAGLLFAVRLPLEG